MYYIKYINNVFYYLFKEQVTITHVHFSDNKRLLKELEDSLLRELATSTGSKINLI